MVEINQRYTGDEAQKYFTSDPNRMFVIIDSAVIIGNIEKEYADFYKAKYYNTLGNNDTAMIIVDGLIDSKYFEENEKFQADVLLFKAKIASDENDRIMLLATAKEASDLCHKLGGEYLVRAADIDSKLGVFLFEIGSEQEGMSKINEAIKNIGDVSTIDMAQKLCDFYELKIKALMMVDSFGIVPTICDTIISELISYDNRVIGATAEEILSFIDNNCGLFYSYKTIALCEIGDSKKAVEALEECLKTNWSKQKSATIPLINIYAKLKMYNEFDEINKIIDESFSFAVEPSADYVQILMIRAEVAKKRGNKDECIKLYKEAIDVQKKFNKKINDEELLNNLTFYEFEKARYEFRAKFLRSTLFDTYSYTIFLLILAFLILAFNFFISESTKRELTNLIIERRESPNDASAAKDTDIANADEPADDKTMKQMAELYAKVKELMDSKKPFTDPEFDIAMLARLLGTNTSYISRTINRMEGKNFRTWLSEYRNNVVIDCIYRDKNISVGDICEMAGYANRETLCRHFKNINGITIGDFKEQMSARNAE